MAKKKKAQIILTPEQQQEEDYKKAVRRMEGAEKMLQAEDRLRMYKEAMQMFAALGNYEDSEVRRKRCKKLLPLARQEYREEVYQTGMKLKANAKSSADFEEAIAEFQKIKIEYKDIPDQIAECKCQLEKAAKSERNKDIGKKLLAFAVIAAIVGIVLYFQTPAAHYQQGKILMKTGHYSYAKQTLARNKGYKDSKELILECNYQLALNFAEEGKYARAVKILRNRVGDYKDALEKRAQFEMDILAEAQIGDSVNFGLAKWVIVDSASQKLLLVKQKPAKSQTVFQEQNKAANWETSLMRSWLNNGFFSETFSPYEQASILPTEVTTLPNRTYGTNGGAATIDRVFLLDENEALRYSTVLPHSSGKKSWWLRTPGKNRDSMAFVSAEGALMHYGYLASSLDIAARPAIWVNVPQR